MKQVVLTGLGNEVDLRTNKTVFTATFNGKVRVPIPEDSAKELLAELHEVEPEEPRKIVPPTYAHEPKQERELEAEEFGGDLVGTPMLMDEPGSVYDDDTGLEQV